MQLYAIVSHTLQRSKTVIDNSDMPLEDIISAEEAAPLIGKSRLAMYRAIRLGHIPLGVYWRVGRDIHVSRKRLLAWRDAGGTAGGAV